MPSYPPCHSWDLGSMQQSYLSLEQTIPSQRQFGRTLTEIETLHTKITQMGPLSWDKVKTVALINALSGDYKHLQSSIQQLADDPNFTSSMIVRCIKHEANLIKRRAEQGDGPIPHTSTASSTSIALAAQARPRQRPVCTHCHRLGHTADFCISPGGKYAGHSLDEARAAQAVHWAAQCAALGRTARNERNYTMPAAPTTHIASSNNTLATAVPDSPQPGSFVINGVTYTATSSPTLPATIIANI
jgi:hypothetical protein